jgi:tRNA(Ile)-lysidine synthase
MRTRLTAKIAAALDRIGVRRPGLILLGLSGGADSVALLHALVALRERFGYRLAAAHLNHRIRGAESDRDEAFVRELCSANAIELAVGHAEGLEPAWSNLEERARDQRLDFLRRTTDRLGADYLALAHQANDQAETVLMRLLRGAGAAGLGVMAEAGPGKIIRPMLSGERREILDYLRAIGAGFVTDSTNASREILRNRVRNELIPMLERDYSPGLGKRLVELAAEMRSLNGLLDELAEAELRRRLTGEEALDLTGVAELHPALAAAVLRAFVRRRAGTLRRVGRAHVEALRHLCRAPSPSGTADLPGGWRAEREYQVLRLRRPVASKPTGFAAGIKLDGEMCVREAGFIFRGRVLSESHPAMPSSLFEALFDSDRIGSGLMARNFRRGDRIRPLGVEGSRKVKDVFIDHKIPRSERVSYPLVTAGDEIVWIPGLVRGDGALVTETTRKVIRLRADKAREKTIGCATLNARDSVLRG